LRTLLRDRSFRRLTLAQFLTVFNDNAYKQVLLLLAVAQDSQGSDLQARAGFLFAAPFLLFAVMAGDLADRFSKRSVVLAAKGAEVGIMLLGALALARGVFAPAAAVLLLTGVQSAFLGPAKYGILPELVPGPALARANGLFQLTVLVGILVGTGSAGLIKTVLEGRLWIAGLFFAGIALLGTWAAAGIRPLPAADPGRRIRWNVLVRMKGELRRAAGTPGLLAAMLGHATFFMVGGVVLFAWNEMGSRILEVGEGLWSLGLASLSLSLALSCLLAGHLSRSRLRLDLVPLGGVLLGLSFLAVGLGPREPGFILGALFLGNLAAGLYLIPLRTLIQELPADADKGRTLGTSQLLDWTFILGSSALKELMHAFSIDAVATFLVLAGLMIPVSLLVGGRTRAGRPSADTRRIRK